MFDVPGNCDYGVGRDVLGFQVFAHLVTGNRADRLDSPRNIASHGLVGPEEFVQQYRGSGTGRIERGAYLLVNDLFFLVYVLVPE